MVLTASSVASLEPVTGDFSLLIMVWKELLAYRNFHIFLLQARMHIIGLRLSYFLAMQCKKRWRRQKEEIMCLKYPLFQDIMLNQRARMECRVV